MWTRCAKPASSTHLRNTPSAVGERQILPMQTKSTDDLFICIFPGACAFDRAAPCCEPLTPFVGSHVGLEALFRLPLRRDLFLRRPEADSQPRQIGGAERSGFGDHRPHD